MTKVALAVVTNRMVQPKMVLSLANLIAHTSHEVITIVATESFTTAQGRIYCVIQAQKAGCSHVLFLDDDMLFEFDTLDRLLAHGKEIVGVNSYSRILPLSSTVGLMDKEGKYIHPDKHTAWEMKVPDELFECFSIGTGVALIDIKVFESIEKPWFKFNMHEDGYMIEGEDSWFCSQARNKGYKIWCDGTLEILHVGNYLYGKKEDVHNETFIKTT